MNKKMIIAGIILLVVMAGGAFYWLSTPSGRIWRWGIHIQLSGYRQTDYSTEKTPASSVEHLQLTDGATTVYIDKTIIQSHEKYIADRSFLFTSLFLPTTSPYPGVITNIVNCASEFLPKEERVTQGIVYRVSAGDRFNYGICSPDLIRYSSIYGIFDCGPKGVIEIRMFSQSPEKKKLEDLLSSFGC